MNVRLTLTCGVAVILASFSVYPLIQGWGWFFGGAGAAIVVTGAALLTRLPSLPSIITGAVLAAAASLPLLYYPTWYIKIIPLAVVAVTVASSVLRRYVVIYLAALLLYLNVGYAAGRSLIGFLPTRASLHQLGTLASAGLDERAFRPPVPGIHGVVLLAAGGVGLMAVATDLLAVRLRSPALAGLPLLALYSVPITTNAHEGGLGATIVFCLAVIGYLAVLAADGRDRLRIWGRLVTVWQYKVDTEAQGPDTKALAAAGRRIGLAAVCIAIILPLVLPGVSVHGLFSGHTPGPGGKTRVALPDPIAQMQRQLLASNAQTVLTYKTNSRDPGDQYLQVYVLNSGNNAAKWTLVTPGNSTVVDNKPLRRAPGTTKTLPETSVRTQVKLASQVSGYSSKLTFLPVPYAPSALDVSGEWAEDNSTLMVYSTKTALGGLSYTADSKIVTPSSTQLRSAPSGSTAAPAQDFTDMPVTDSRLLARLAARIVRGKATAIEQALALQQWFLTDNRFTYSLTPKLPDSTAGLVRFLTKTRAGYCQQFAIGMAVLARFLNIPSRVAVGYTAGERDGGSWRVTTADAHAWPELYFSGIGWLRFEPTPAGPDGQGTAVEPGYARTQTGGPAPPIKQNQGGTGSTGGIGKTQGNGNLSKLNHLPNPGAAAGGAANKLTHGGSSFPVWLVIVVILALGLVTPGTARLLTRRYRWRHAPDDVAAAHAAWRELCDDLADHGMACRPSETPRSVSRRISSMLALDKTARQALARIAEAQEQACYAKAPRPAADLPHDVATVRRAMASEASPLRRWQARVFPSSMLTPARAGVIYALDVFGWMEAAGQRFRARAKARSAQLAESHHHPRQVLG